MLAGFALIWWLTESTGSATVLAMATMVELLPGVVLGPFVGALVDRWNRRRVMLVADSVIALFSAWLAYLFWTGSLQTGHVYAIMAVRAIGGAPFAPYAPTPLEHRQLAEGLFLDRARNWASPPGSVFKMIPIAAALASGKLAPDQKLV